ncbi:MAG TPA: CusA/CzcA family heavy metal efflux RND transporter [Flavobacteriales bacterium]|nr:CusA/CzcA family heavy metal efflux RND transporter [Flavobacteriales bacterium]
MLNKIIEFSVNNKLIIGLFIIALIGFGSYEFTRLPIDAVPDITNNQVQVIAVAPSLGATDIERLVTFPIELANSNIAGMHEIRSFSRFGLSLVTIVFNDDVDVYWARQQVAERLLQVQAEIPKGVGSITLGPVTTGLGEIYQYIVRPKKGYEHKYSAMDLRTIQDWIVRRQLLGVKGVADVSSFGGQLKQYEIAVEPNKLKANNITINDIFAALENNNQNTGGAYIEKGPTVQYIRSEGLVGSIRDIENTFIRNTSNGTPLLIRDVATVQYGSATRYGALCYNDQGEVAGAIVMMLKGANSSEVIHDVKERVAQIQKSLPEGVVIEPFLDRTKMVNNAIGTVETNLMEGALIVLFVLILFLGNLRAGFIVASVIPLAMLFAVIMMNLFGVSGNLMSFGALDFGLIVDGAVIIVEAVLHQLTHSKSFLNINRFSKEQMDKEVKSAAGRMMNSAVFGQVIILVVYLPILSLQGIEGKMFKPMAETVAFALTGAFLLSLTYVPMMTSLMMSKNISHKPTFSDRMMTWVERHYQQALKRVLVIPKSIITGVIVLFSVSLFILSQLGGEFIPALEEGDFAVETRVLTGSNLSTTIESTQKAAGILKSRFPEVLKVVTKIGSGEIPTDPMPMEAADMMVILKDKSEWTSAETFDELAEKMTVAISEVPGITVSFQYPVQMRFNELMTGAKQDVVCKIFGENIDTLAAYAQKLGELSSTVDGTKNVYVEPVTGLPQIVIEYNRAAIAQFGLSIADINKVVNIGLAGQSTGFVYEGEKRFDLVVRLNGQQRKNIEDVRNLLIPTSEGQQVPLSQLANVELKDGPNQIQREDAKRRIIVGFNARGRDVQSIVNELQEKVGKTIKLPPGYFITYGGAFENLNAAKARLSITVPVSLLLIFLLLYFSFNSIRQGLLIYSAIPLSAMGGIFALSLRGMPFSISAGVGFIALFGVAVLNGIVLVAEFNRLKKEGWTDLKKIVVMGTKIRLRPVLMTAFVASLGFLPMAVSNGAGAEVQRPLATVVIGGLLIATFLTLFVLPVLYILFEKKADKKASVKNPPVAQILIAVLLLGAGIGHAQTPIKLQAAIDTALKNNLKVKQQELLSNYQKQLEKTAWDLPQTSLGVEYGMINSRYTDNRFGLAQSFSFPTVYTRQKQLLREEYKSSLLQLDVNKAELRRSVREAYFNLYYLNEKKKLLQRADSLYGAFLVKAEARFKSGESNILEVTSASAQRGQMNLQLQHLEMEQARVQAEFQLLLNTSTQYIPDVGSTNELTITPSLQFNSNNPHLLVLEQNKVVSHAAYRTEKARLMPSLNVAYSNMTMFGSGSDNKSYTYNTRFQSGQFGLGLPIFTGAQRARIKAAGIQQQIAEYSFSSGMIKMQSEYQLALQQLDNYRKAQTYYDETGVPNSKLIIETANRQLNNGDINYLEWVILTNQAIQIQNESLGANYQFYNALIHILYLNNN